MVDVHEELVEDRLRQNDEWKRSYNILTDNFFTIPVKLAHAQCSIHISLHPPEGWMNDILTVYLNLNHLPGSNKKGLAVDGLPTTAHSCPDPHVNAAFLVVPTDTFPTKGPDLSLPYKPHVSGGRITPSPISQFHSPYLTRTLTLIIAPYYFISGNNA